MSRPLMAVNTKQVPLKLMVAAWLSMILTTIDGLIFSGEWRRLKDRTIRPIFILNNHDGPSPISSVPDHHSNGTEPASAIMATTFWDLFVRRKECLYRNRGDGRCDMAKRLCCGDPSAGIRAAHLSTMIVQQPRPFAANHIDWIWRSPVPSPVLF
jgi:hypothetical protein